MTEIARNPTHPKVSAVSTMVNRRKMATAFMFRNEGHFPGINSYYLGGCWYKMWQAISTSPAASGYFSECAFGK